ncbi:hypothetical protein N6H14_21890 [Paenibacillus sp. CC-CFT747]|nr:hypothetical protein N6H14_21890 [Paenibacillus sp. CC-CFT747]
MAYSTCGPKGWGFGLAPEDSAPWKAPVKVHGYTGSWLHLGPFAEGGTSPRKPTGI